MTTREKVAIGLTALVIAINIGVAIAIGVATDETNPLMYVGFAIPVVVLGLIMRASLRRWRTRVRAKAAGTKGKLRVLSASELAGGVATVNQQPLLRLELELTVPGAPPERFSKRMVVPRLAVPAVMAGETFDAWVDPKDRRRFDVQW